MAAQENRGIKVENGRVLVNRVKLSEFFGVSLGAIAPFCDQGVFTPVREEQIKNTFGRGVRPSMFFDLGECIQGYINYKTKKTTTQERSEADRARAQLTQAKADMQLLQNQIATGEVLLVDQVRQGWFGVLTRFKTKLFAIPNQYAPRLAIVKDEKKALKLLEEAIGEAIAELEVEPVYGDASLKRPEGIYDDDDGDEGNGEDAKLADDAKNTRVNRKTVTAKLAARSVRIRKAAKKANRKPVG